MNFHFPLMPRMFMALAAWRTASRSSTSSSRRRRSPTTCQWAMFLRNHDELTLEMVTDEERDYMYRAYAARAAGAHQPRHPPPARAAARQRPAPDRADERRCCSRCRARRSSTTATRSGWATTSTSATATACARRCSGAPTATPASRARTRSSCTCRSIIDPEYHYEAINVEAQQANPTSLLWWMKRLIALRKRHPAFGRGTIEFLTADNPRVLAFVRALRGRAASSSSRTCRASSSTRARPRRVPRATVPVELFGRIAVPRDRRARRTSSRSAPHAFYWFALERAQAARPRLRARRR